MKWIVQKTIKNMLISKLVYRDFGLIFHVRIHNNHNMLRKHCNLCLHEYMLHLDEKMYMFKKKMPKQYVYLVLSTYHSNVQIQVQKLCCLHREFLSEEHPKASMCIIITPLTHYSITELINYIYTLFLKLMVRRP